MSHIVPIRIGRQLLYFILSAAAGYGWHIQGRCVRIQGRRFVTNNYGRPSLITVHIPGYQDSLLYLFPHTYNGYTVMGIYASILLFCQFLQRPIFRHTFQGKFHRLFKIKKPDRIAWQKLFGDRSWWELKSCLYDITDVPIFLKISRIVSIHRFHRLNSAFRNAGTCEEQAFAWFPKFVLIFLRNNHGPVT